MSRVDILIGSELALYREALRATFLAMRPDLEVRSAPHDELDALACELRPLLVISNFIQATVSACSPACITLFPDGRDEAIVSVGDAIHVIPNATIAELLGVVDDLQAAR